MFPSKGMALVDLLRALGEVTTDEDLLLTDGLLVTRPNIETGDTVAARRSKMEDVFFLRISRKFQ